MENCRRRKTKSKQEVNFKKSKIFVLRTFWTMFFLQNDQFRHLRKSFHFPNIEFFFFLYRKTMKWLYSHFPLFFFHFEVKPKKNKPFWIILPHYSLYKIAISESSKSCHFQITKYFLQQFCEYRICNVLVQFFCVWLAMKQTTLHHSGLIESLQNGHFRHFSQSGHSSNTQYFFEKFCE